jgi:serine O-acetyltransferase
MLGQLREDIQTILDRDPAAKSSLEVFLCYPGLHAVWSHRVAQGLWQMGLRLPARLLSQVARFWTGIEIHPAAQLGRRLFIDHGMGVVIGETAVVGEDVTLYQGVTLGGTGKEKGKRHPTLENKVVVGSGAKILGNILIGEAAQIGASSVVLKSVPKGATVVGVPGRVLTKDAKRLSRVIQMENLGQSVHQLEKQLMGMRHDMESLVKDVAHDTGTHLGEGI